MKIAVFLIAFIFPILGFCEWVKYGGEPIPENESMKSSGNFAVHIVLTDSEPEFRKSWNSTSGIPKLKSVNSVKIGSSIAAMIIFSGCEPSSAGVCDVSVEFLLEDPNGEKSSGGKGPVWTTAPLQPGMQQLGLASMNMGFGPNDPVGAYKVLAKITDKNSGRVMNISSRFSVER